MRLLTYCHIVTKNSHYLFARRVVGCIRLHKSHINHLMPRDGLSIQRDKYAKFSLDVKETIFNFWQ